MRLCVTFAVTASFSSLGLEWDLNVRLHGQHLVRQLVLRTVRGYLETPQPDKALALSFHGWSGTGKNFVARMLVENLYRDGLMSDCVRMFIATFHFPHRKYVDLYKVRPTRARVRPLCWEEDPSASPSLQGSGLWRSLGRWGQVAEPVTEPLTRSTSHRGPEHLAETGVPNTPHRSVPRIVTLKRLDAALKQGRCMSIFVVEVLKCHRQCRTEKSKNYRTVHMGTPLSTKESYHFMCCLWCGTFPQALCHCNYIGQRVAYPAFLKNRPIGWAQ